MQGCEKGEDGKMKWHEDKVGTVTSYIRGDGKEKEEGGREPQKLVTTHVATIRTIARERSRVSQPSSGVDRP